MDAMQISLIENDNNFGHVYCLGCLLMDLECFVELIRSSGLIAVVAELSIALQIWFVVKTQTEQSFIKNYPELNKTLLKQ